MRVNPKKEVRYDLYCSRCEHKDLEDFKDPCNDCLEEFTNDGTDKPRYFEEKGKSNK